MSLVLTTALGVGSSIIPVLLMRKLAAVPTSPGTAKAKASSRFFWSTVSDLSSARPLSHCSHCLTTAYAIRISFLSQRLAPLASQYFLLHWVSSQGLLTIIFNKTMVVK